jgi:hypothetical protein
MGESTSHNGLGETEVYRDGLLHVRGEPCDRCLFGADRLVDGPRARAIIRDARAREGGTFVCHRSQIADVGPAICSVYFDRFAKEDMLLRLAIAMNIVQRINEHNQGETSAEAEAGDEHQLRAERLDESEGPGPDAGGRAVDPGSQDG